MSTRFEAQIGQLVGLARVSSERRAGVSWFGQCLAGRGLIDLAESGLQGVLYWAMLMSFPICSDPDWPVRAPANMGR